MRDNKWLLKAIFSEALKTGDIAEFRELMQITPSDKQIRLHLVNRMLENSEGMKEYLDNEKLTTMMSMLAIHLHWHLIYEVLKRQIDQKKMLGKWNDKYDVFMQDTLEQLKGEMFDSDGRWKFGDHSSTGIQSALELLEGAAENVLMKIEESKRRTAYEEIPII